ncbi:hypothetical protein HOE425_333367 [Hoeflea sp. EC-HK425]|nr:hypothetical protein HOE425_333367 [Hoeflea sp. EC-HK425]
MWLSNGCDNHQRLHRHFPVPRVATICTASVGTPGSLLLVFAIGEMVEERGHSPNPQPSRFGLVGGKAQTKWRR